MNKLRAYGFLLGISLTVATAIGCGQDTQESTADAGNSEAVCGDSTVDTDELCDDGNTIGGDGCSADCQSMEICGDGELDMGEGCDDGNNTSGDGCSDNCLLESCGNSILETELGETCDDGNTIGGDGCGTTCQSRSTPVSVVGGRAHSCALFGDGDVKCWGRGSMLGLGDTDNRGDEPGEMGNNLPRVDLGIGQRAVEIVAGEEHTCVRLDDNSVKCWGSGGEGRLGYGSRSSVGNLPNQMGDNLPVVDLGTGRTALQLSAGLNHTCARLDNNSLKCWGGNQLGQLGLGESGRFSNRGDAPDEMGDNLPTIDLGTGRSVLVITSGRNHTCALLDNRTLKCWGEGQYGQLGRGDSSDVIGDELNEMGDNLPVVDLGTGRTAVEIAGGETHTCARLDSGSVKCWGANSTGQLGLGNFNYHGRSLNSMGDNLPPVDLGSDRTSVGLKVGYNQSCAILDTGAIKCWGRNGGGSLGIGRNGMVPDDDGNAGIGDQPNEMGDNLPTIFLGTGKVASSLGTGWHTCALLDDHSIKCWGTNVRGQLGLGDIEIRGDTLIEMGDNLPALDFGVF